MPPRVRFDKQAIVQAGLNVVRRGGMEALNARAIARELGCSTQPLYRELRNMEELRGEVRAEAGALFGRRLAEWQTGQMPPYKEMGMAFLRFAHEEAALYRLLFLRDRSGEAYQEQEQVRGFAGVNDAIYSAIMRANGYTLEQAKALHLQMFIFIQGLGGMIATRYVPYDEAFLSRALTDEYEALKALYGARKTETPAPHRHKEKAPEQQ